MSPAILTVRQSIDHYLSVKGASRAPGYIHDLSVTLDGLVRITGDIQLRHLSEAHFAQVFDKWSTTRPSTFNKKRGHVQAWLTFASRRRRLKLSPAELLGSVEARRVVPRPRLRLSATELLALLETTRHPRDRMYLALAMQTGLRASEIHTLTLEDVDLEAGDLYVLRHKTGTRDVLPITADLDQELRRWLIAYTGFVGPLASTFLVVPAKCRPSPQPGGRKMTDSEAAALGVKPTVQMQRTNTVMRQVLSAAGYSLEWEGLHTIRRSVARASYEYFCEQGETRDDALAVVQVTLGHASREVTERYIGVERFKEKRDRAMRGKPFLSAMAADQTGVRRLTG